MTMRIVRMLGVCLLAAQATTADDHRITAFVDVHVITMRSEDVLEHQTVLVRDRLIARIGPASEIDVPGEATVIDGMGRFLMPGLIDLHVHLQDPRDLIIYPAHGVTTVQDLGGDLLHLDWREEIEAGKRLGPRLIQCGPPITDLDDVNQARSTVMEQAGLGFDCIKIYDAIAKEAYQALIDEARDRGLRSVGHIPRNLTWQDMLDAKPDSVAHAEEFLYSPLEGEDVEPIGAAMKASGTSLITTLVTYDMIGRQVVDVDPLLARSAMKHVPPPERRVWGQDRNPYRSRFEIDRVATLRRLLQTQKVLIKRWHAQGVKILLGTDAGGVPFVFPGWAAIEELRNLTSAGLTPFEALKAATVDAAEDLGLSGRVGVVEVGHEADLILLWDSPLRDIANADLLAGTMIRGEWAPVSLWKERLDRLERDYTREAGLLERFDREGVEAAVASIEKIARSEGRSPLSERTLNELGYQLWRIEDRLDDALAVFALNARLRPESWIALDSLSEAQGKAGRIDDAIRNARRSLELEPRNRDLEERLQVLLQDRQP